MKKTKVILFSILSIFLLSLSVDAMPGEDRRKKRKKKSSKKEVKVVVKTPAQKEKESYNKLIKGAVTNKGMFTTHFTTSGELYFEINKDLENRVFLISNRISTTTDTKDFVAGQMVGDPFMVRFKLDSNRVVMYRVRTGYEIDENDPIKISYDKNLGDGILRTFKPLAQNGKNTVINVTAFFGANEKTLTPLVPYGSFGKSTIKATFSKEDSYITGVKTFPNNIEIKSLLNFDRGASMSYTLGMHRSFVMLPEVPMKRRKQDNRIGYFSLKVNEFSSLNDGIKSKEYINRWRMEPREEDMAKYFAGELVTPKKQIIFYVDNAFPEKWRSTVIQGVNDWKLAFEAAGFKDAITARMYPTIEEDPDFDPDDMRYNCIKYATTDIANAMGPSFVDPRSGEILVGDVIWYHNVVSLVHNWRFVQTAAVDSRVRKLVFDNDLMCESLRYVTSHEVGHTLGLMHNMGASYSYPVDSLRSPSFTQRYGTTPSIMDYARNNYIAQPGDLEKGVRLTPPILGVYDIHAINWGYRLFKDSSPANVKKELSKIIADKDGDDMYRFGAQQAYTIDPTDLTEDLGDDHIKASDYCISNLKIILNNLQEWHKDSGESYEELVNVYKEVLKQYHRVVFHVTSDIGGIELKEVMQGEPSSNKTAVYKTKAEQKRVMLWVINQARTNLEWITPKYVIDRFSQDNILPNVNDNMAAALVSTLFNPAAIGRMYVSSVKLGDKKAYTVDGYLNDLVNATFSKSVKQQNLSSSDMEIEAVTLDQLMKLSGVSIPKIGANKSLSEIAEETLATYKDNLNKSAFACSHSIRNSHLKGSCGCSAASHSSDDESLNSFFRMNMKQTTAPKVLTEPIAYSKIKWIKNLYKNKRAGANNATRNFYDYQLVKIDKFLLIK